MISAEFTKPGLSSDMEVSRIYVVRTLTSGKEHIGYHTTWKTREGYIRKGPGRNASANTPVGIERARLYTEEMARRMQAERDLNRAVARGEDKKAALAAAQNALREWENNARPAEIYPPLNA